MKYILPALLSGILLAISWPTYGIPFFIFFALVPLLLTEHRIDKFSKIKHKGWTIFGLSYLSFVIWNTFATGWLYGAKNPDGSHSLMAVLFPILFNSFLHSLVFLCYHKFKSFMGTYWGFAFFIAIWMSYEKLELSWQLSWPWLNLGNAFSEYPKLIQWYDTFGATGGSLWILMINLMIFYTIRIWEASRKRKKLIVNISISIAMIVLPMLISLYKYQTFNEKPIGEVNVLMLQPDLDPYSEKYSKDSLTIASELIDLARKNSTGPIDFYIAPETALPGYGSYSETGLNHSPTLNSIKTFLAEHPKSVFETGISSHRFFYDNKNVPKSAYQLSPDVWVESYNSALQLSPTQKDQIYHKGKLVAGVESFPYMNILKPILGNVMINLGGTMATLGTDPERKVFGNNFNKGKMAPIICYESVYGEFVTDYIRKGANFLGIMTNDSWWGVTQGHKQLLSYARLRAIETRREIARSANSGISAHINARGDVLEDTLYGDKTALFAKIKLYDSISNYTKIGDLLNRIAIFCLGFCLIYLLSEWLQKRKMEAQKKIMPTKIKIPRDHPRKPFNN